MQNYSSHSWLRWGRWRLSHPLPTPLFYGSVSTHATPQAELHLIDVEWVALEFPNRPGHSQTFTIRGSPRPYTSAQVQFIPSIACTLIPSIRCTFNLSSIVPAGGRCYPRAARIYNYSRDAGLPVPRTFTPPKVPKFPVTTSRLVVATRNIGSMPDEKRIWLRSRSKEAWGVIAELGCS